MGLHRLNSDLSIPVSSWIQLDPPTQATPTAVKFTANPLFVQKAIIRCDAANTGSLSIGPNNSTSFVTGMQKTDEYLIESEPGSRFDLSQWYVSFGTNGDLIHIIYQP